MKRIYFLLFIIPISLFSCDDDDTVQVSTSLPITITVDVTEPSAIHQKSGQSEYSFAASKTYYLSNNADVKEYLDKMTHVANKGYTGEITGLEDGEIINDIKISVSGGDELMAFENVTNLGYGNSGPYGGYSTYDQILFSEKQITINVSGTTNKAPMDFDVNMTLLIEIYSDEM